MNKRDRDDDVDECDESGEEIWTKQEEEDKTGFPQLEKDVAPSALIPGAIKVIVKHGKKLSLLIDRFDGKLSENQAKQLGAT